MTGDYRLCALILWPMIGALIGYQIGHKNKIARDYFADVVVITEFILLMGMFRIVFAGVTPEFRFSGMCGLNFHLRLDGFREVYCMIAAFIWVMTTLISREYFEHYHNRNRYYAFVLPTLGATLGLFMSADLFTTFLFYQIITITTFVGIAHDEKDTAVQAATTYLASEMTGGCFVLMGLIQLYHLFGTLEIDVVRECVLNMEDRGPAYVAGFLLFLGFSAKAGIFPFHFWMPRAHSGAPAPISTLLSSIITKTGLYGVILICSSIFMDNQIWGKFVLVLGTFTMLLGATRALFDIHMKRILAFSSLSQMGFILIGIGASCSLGAENLLAVRGAILHMVNHSFLKLVLYLCVAVIYMKTHTLELNDIRGYGHGKPLLHFAYLMGALGISGVPLWNGYISKTLLHEAIVECMHLGGSSLAYEIVEVLFLLAGGMTFAYMTKLYVCLFLEKHPTDQEKHDSRNGHYMGKLATVALFLAALVPPVLGMRPYETLDKIADYGQTIMTHLTMDHAVHYFDPHVMKGAFVSIGFGVLIYFLLVRKAFMKKNGDGVMEYVYRWPQWLDLEYLVYRPFLYIIIPHICGRLCYMLDQPLIMRALRKLKVESRWMKNREKKKEEKKKENWKKATKKRMKDSNKYR